MTTRLLLIAVLTAAAHAAHADAPASVQRALAALPYLSSSVPDQRARAETIVSSAAVTGFERLVAELPRQPRPGREALLRILAETGHGGRVELCLDILCRPDGRRSERLIAARALARVDATRLLDVLSQRLHEADLSPFARAQCMALIGLAPGSRAQSLAEDLLAQAAPGSLEAERLEVALLRSILASGAAEPAWARWQRRRPEGPRCGFRDLQNALSDLALPLLAQRIQAETRLHDMLAGDTRVLMAIAGSALPERAAFGLAALRRSIADELQLATLLEMMDLVVTARQDSALLAIDVAVACAPPTQEDLNVLRPLATHDAIAKLEAVLEGLGRGGNLAELRRRHARISAQLRPLLLRRGALDDEARAVMRELSQVRNQLDSLEGLWRGGWRREFETEVTG